MIRPIILTATLLLPACSLFDNSDPREGGEVLEECIARVATAKTMQAYEELVPDGGLLIPTYTYDVTKMDLDGMQSLIVEGSDETAGSRGMTSTNETSTAEANFLAQPVDESGAFFLGRDPALYRVRGEPLPVDEVVPAGCNRQKAGMRLLAFSARVAPLQPSDTKQPETADPENENAS